MSAASTDRRVTTIGSGAVEGVVDGATVRYLGIPYAAAPFGENRFRAPQPVTPWTGIRAASSFGPTAPQEPYSGGLEKLLPTVSVPGDDILNLNIWAPANPGDALLPVMVWMHGGSLAHGSNALAAYDGATFARDGVIFVAPNYRLGAEGFSVLEDAPLNLGLADQRAALRWVQNEIEHFGGDPRRVTIFGQSAGGALVAALATRSDAEQLMQRAIVQSGPLNGQPRATAARITELMAKDLGVPATRAGFGGVSPEDLVASQRRATAGTTPLTGGAAFVIAIDGELMPANPVDAFVAGAAANIPILIGTTTEEYRLWFLPTGLLGTFTRVHLLVARLRFRVSAAAVRLYRRGRPGASPGELLGALATDLLLRAPLAVMADARLKTDAPTWVYEFDWRSPVAELGAAHAMELGFVFDGLASPDSIALAGADAPQSLATSMHDAWIAFARDGDPGWARWSTKRPVRSFDGADDPVVYAPRDEELRALPAAR
jgi:para-nitrobenzyl esterase